MATGNVITSAIQPVITRYGATRFDPLLFAAGAVGVAAACVAAMLRRSGELAALIDPRYRVRLFALSMAGTLATTLALIYGLQRIDAVAGVLLLQVEPVYSLGMATLLVGERPPLRQLLATATILLGIGCVLGAPGTFSPAYAAVLVLVTPLFWQTAHVLSLTVMPPLTPLCITGARYVYSAFVLLALLVVLDRRALTQLADPVTLAVIAATGFGVYFLGTLAWYGAIKRLTLAWTTALVVPGNPILALLFAIVFLGERPSARELAGLAVAAAGVATLVLGSRPRQARPAAESAEAIHYPLS